MLRVLLVLLALLAAVPTSVSAAERIVGGSPASRAYEHQAFLQVTFANGRTGRCGGSLIAARYVLTAAHCLRNEGSPATAVEAVLGVRDRPREAPPENRYPVQAATPHPAFDEASGGYDVAVLQLTRASPYQQARLPRPADAPLWHAGTIATVIGWGLTEDPAENGQPSDALLEVQVPIFADDACAAEFSAVGASDTFFQPETMVCAGGKDGKDACDGDSGGPLLVPAGADLPLAVSGVVSFGAVFRDAAGNRYSCAENVPGIYSRVAADPLNAWVRSVVPQVEIDLAPAEPEPGQEVTMTASGTGYPSFEWDLDGDGAFDDATGQTTSRRFDPGVATVGVRAGGSEIRRIPIHARFRSPVSFDAATVTVREGRPIVLAVTKSSRGAGSVTAQPSAGTARLGEDVAPGGVTLTFGADQPSLPVSLPTVQDRRVEGPETMRLDLVSHTGELLPGTPGQVLVTILDDDRPPRVTRLPRSARVRSGRARLRYAVNVPGRIQLTLQDRRSGRSLGSVRRLRRSAGTFTDTVRLNAAGRRRLARSRRVPVRLVVAILDGHDVLASRRGTLTLRR